MDRTILPIQPPEHATITELDAKNSTPPEKFEIKAPEGAPNVVVVLIDDIGIGATSTFGGPISTPAFDRLADEGIRYTRFHTTVLCSPARSSLLSGRNHHNVKLFLYLWNLNTADAICKEKSNIYTLWFLNKIGSGETIKQLMSNLERFINDSNISDLDPLVKMAIIHFQFESIHPFYDGNGRTGRIINILYLILQNLQNLPILYLSGYIVKTKSEYYKHLQQVREKNSWEEWILYMVEGIEQTAVETIALIQEIKELMLFFKNHRCQLSKQASRRWTN
jgi:hypothetical protein